MTDQEVNKIIAEFMGWKYHAEHDPSAVFTHEIYSEKQPSYFKYTKSLDELVEVWEKLGNDRFYFNFDLCSTFCVNEFIIEGKEDDGWGRGNYHSQSGDSIQQAAAHATAKAILEIGENK